MIDWLGLAGAALMIILFLVAEPGERPPVRSYKRKGRVK